MKTKQLTIIAILILISSINIHPTKAWGPVTHIYYTERALRQAGSTTLTDIINNNKEWFLCGLMYPDVTVLYYYTQWKSYSATHAWEFQRRRWNDAVDKNSKQAMAFALGVGVHLLQDSITHNIWIPEKIRATFVQNNIIHPLSEGLLEARLAVDDPLAEAMAKTSFLKWDCPFTDSNAFYDSTYGRNLTPVEWADRILGRTVEDSFRDEASTFNTILSGGQFYSKGYVLPSSGGWWSIYIFFSNIVKNFVSTEDANKYINATIDATVEWLRSGQGGNPQAYVGQIDPTGYYALKDADSFIVNWTIVLLIISSIIVIFYYRKKKK